MLRTTKNMKDKYEKIQTYLFSLIPEKWEEIYLYASVATEKNNSKKGELYFYYFPKGILKKKPINVYEVPRKFNINEEQYLEVVQELYNCIKELHQDFIDTEQDLWNSITISITHDIFKIEFNYDNLPLSESGRNALHIIWRYKYLKIGGDKKEEQGILEEYFSSGKEEKIRTYETGFYMRSDNSIVSFDKEDSKIQKEVVIYEKEENVQPEFEKLEEDTKETKIDLDDNDDENQTKRNQILDM